MGRKVSAVLASVAALALCLASAGTSQASSHPPPRLSWALISQMTPAQVAALQDPLIAIADPVSSVAASKMASLYSTVALDTPRHTVDVYVTDVAKAGQLLRAVKEKEPNLDLGHVRVMKAAYSLAALTRATNRLTSPRTARHLPFRIYVLAQVGYGRALQLQVADPAAARGLSTRPIAALGGRSVRQLAGVALTFTHGVPVVPASRENDGPPQIGGDQSYGWNSHDGSRQYCTTGIAVENSSGEDGLIEAGHCFTPHNGVYTDGNFDTFIGTVGDISHPNDSEIIWTGKYLGGGSNADEGESDGCGGICYHPLIRTANPVANEYACQDGFVSYYVFHRGVSCNNKFKGPATYSVCGADGGCATVNAWESDSNNGNPVAAAGDSGAVVFTVNSGSSTRNAVGMVNAEPAGCDPFCTTMYFVPQGQIMSAMSVHLNPYS